MSTNAFGRLTRVTDLFVEGAELVLADDDGTGTPVVVWIKKLNSFEDAESRRDAMAARAIRILDLKNEDNADRVNVLDQIDRQGDDWLREQIVEGGAEEDYLKAVDDVESDADWATRLEDLRRVQAMMADHLDAPDDPRWRELADQNLAYLEALQTALKTRSDERAEEVGKYTRDELIEKFLELWMERQSSSDWIQAKQVTEVYYALRDCQATKAEDGHWDHRTCNHGRRLLEERSMVRELPQEMLEKVVGKIRELTLTEREAGNSDAPMTSSGSSEPQSAQEV
jgi:hypothetical protein